jgi:protein involved in polysaccharide export with SLBB domain
MNFKVSVQGEVTLPGTYNVVSERLTVIEALTMAHDLTIYGLGMKKDGVYRSSATSTSLFGTK